jgi:predicted metal-binding membrane protein
MASILRSATRPDGQKLTLIENGALAASLGAITLLAWGYLVYQAWAMDHMDLVDMAMPGTQEWGVRDLILIFTMWAVMMVGMMAPSASPMVMLFARIQKGRDAEGRTMAASVLFLLGYLLVWTGFSLAATLIQWGLHNAMLISPMMVGTNPLLGGVVLVAAGIYQWTPAKQACLMRCRSPIGFLLTEWRDGDWGALVMGFRHGLYCTGCCWLLMLILFVVGVMNLLWVALLTAYVLLEKFLPQDRWMSRVTGLALLGWGIWMARVALT